MMASCFPKKINQDVQIVLSDLNILLDNVEFDNSFSCIHLLNKIIQITESEFGFIAVLTNNSTELVGHTITDFAWNEETQKFFIDNSQLLKFPINNPCFKTVLDKKEAISIDNPKSFLANGHPKIKRILCVPIFNNSEIIGLIGLCNKFEKYTKKDIKNTSYILKQSDEIRRYITM